MADEGVIRAPSAVPVHDALIPFEVASLDLRGRMIKLGPALDELLSKHAYPPQVSKLLGEAIVLTTLLGSSLKFEGRFILQTQTDGPVSMIVVNFTAPDALRAYARFDASRFKSGQSSADLLGAQEVLVRGILEVAAVERHQSLVAAHVRALVDGHGEVATAEQVGGREPGLQPACVEARIGAQRIGRGEIDDDHRHRAVGLGLQDEAAVEFQRGAEQRCQHDGLAEQLADGRGIIVLGQDLVERRAKPHQATAHVERIDLVGQHGVIDRNR